MQPSPSPAPPPPVREELRMYNPDYCARPHVVALNKMDLLQAAAAATAAAAADSGAAAEAAEEAVVARMKELVSEGAWVEGVAMLLLLGLCLSQSRCCCRSPPLLLLTRGLVCPCVRARVCECRWRQSAARRRLRRRSTRSTPTRAPRPSARCPSCPAAPPQVTGKLGELGRGRERGRRAPAAAWVAHQHAWTYHQSEGLRS